MKLTILHKKKYLYNQTSQIQQTDGEQTRLSGTSMVSDTRAWVDYNHESRKTERFSVRMAMNVKICLVWCDTTQIW
jgi:hypothetical protein